MTTNTQKQFLSAQAEWAQMPIVLTVEEVGAILGIGQQKAYRLITKPGFPMVKIGKTYKIYRDGLRSYLEGHIEGKEGSIA